MTKKTFYVDVEATKPMEASYEIEAESKEEAQKIVSAEGFVFPDSFQLITYEVREFCWRVTRIVTQEELDKEYEEEEDRRRLLKKAKQLGCTVEDDGVTLTVDAPDGKIFSSTMTHVLAIAYDSPPGAWKKGDAYKALVEDMELGCHDCEDPDCDACRGEA